MKYTRARIEAPALETPLTNLAAADGVETVHLLATGITGSETETYSVSLDAPVEIVQDALAADDHVLEWDVSNTETRLVYAYVQCPASGELQCLRGHFTTDTLVVLLPVAFYSDGLELTVLGLQADLSDAFNTLPSVYEATILEVGTYRNGIHWGHSLTERQREVLEIAYHRGYYERPSETTHEEIAAELACSSSTVGEHLREAERRLVSEVFDAEKASNTNRGAPRS